MTNQPDAEQPHCTDDEIAEDESSPEAHDLVEVDQEPLLELEDCAVYTITRECRRDGCHEQYRSVEIIGPKIKTVQDCKRIAYQLYESCYDDPRNIPHHALQQLIDVPHPGKRNAIANDLADAAQLGHNDAEASRDKRTKQEVFNAVLPDNL